MGAQRVEIGVVADARKHRHDDAQVFAGRRCLLRLDGVLGVQMQAAEHGQHAEHRQAGALFEPLLATAQQRAVTTEAVDDEAAHQRALVIAEAGQRADQMGEHAAAVDVRDDDDRAARRQRETHVRDVALAQIDLGRTAGALDDDEVIGRLQAPP
jgi:hypothetical protein